MQVPPIQIKYVIAYLGTRVVSRLNVTRLPSRRLRRDTYLLIHSLLQR